LGNGEQAFGELHAPRLVHWLSYTSTPGRRRSKQAVGVQACGLAIGPGLCESLI
jgi:hypothetical protein